MQSYVCGQDVQFLLGDTFVEYVGQELIHLIILQSVHHITDHYEQRSWEMRLKDRGPAKG